MSGDVQPRKRKDKKRRKEDAEPIPLQAHVPIFTNNLVNDDVNIHVHKESGTGGGICAKLVFFILLSALAVLIGLIITEHRGLTDLDAADYDSKFSQIFEGWIDTSSNNHDDHDLEDASDADHEDDHDEDHEDLDVSEAEDEDHQTSREEEEHQQSEEDEEEQPSEDDEERELSEEEVDENEDESLEEDDVDNEDRDEENEVDEKNYSEEDNEDVRDDGSEEIDRDDEEEPDEDLDESREHFEENMDELHASEEEEQVNNDDNEQDADEESKEDEVRKDKMVDGDEEGESEEQTDDESADEDDTSTEKDAGIPKDNQRDESSAEKIKVTEKKLSKRNIGAEGDQDEIPETSNMAVKVGVGVAILVVAYLVLIRKWRTEPGETPYTEEENAPTPDLSRRNTIIVPPTYQEVEQDIEQDDEDYSDEEESEDDKQKPEQKSAKWRYQELRSTYSRSLTPESDPDLQKRPKSNEDEYEVHVDEVEEEEEEDMSEEEEDYEIEDEYDDDDEELLKRLEAKYFNIQKDNTQEASETPWKRINTPQDQVGDSDSDRQSDDVEYEHMNITNKDDFKIRREIDEAQKAVDNNPNYAIRLFDTILKKSPSSPRSLYGKALALDLLADRKRSNSILEQALKLFLQLLRNKNIPDSLFELAGERCLNRMRFLGQYTNAILVHKLVIDRFPNIPKHQNDMAVTYLTINRVDDARSVLKRVLAKWPNDGVALVHYGFILKTVDNKLESAVLYLSKGIRTRDKGVLDGRFFFHLGDALTRLGRTEEAMKVYEEGTELKVFLSKYQRSLYNVPRLSGRPWWQPKDLPYLKSFKLLKQNWRKISEEALSILNVKGYFQNESENLKDTGEWKQFELYARGQKNARNCRKCPFTCSIMDQIPEAVSCKRGQTKFSVMHPGTHVWPHCGPTNCRLRTHLGLRVPPNTYIRVASETRSWKEGEILVFDDSFEHEVWHNGTEFRLVLIVDVWHPELTPSEKKNLSPI